jgi:putative NIF3 family GTP cyclohydrolase 1 type 2
MNKEDIIRMAREACDQAPREDWNSTAWVFGDETLERFAALVAAAERRACVKVCEELLTIISSGDEHMDGVTDCIVAIRARGEK